MKYLDYSFDPSDIMIRIEDVIRSVGYADSAIPGYLENHINDILAYIPGLIDPVGGFALFEKVEIKSKSIVLEKKELKTKSIIAGPLAGSESMAIFVCTIGQEVSSWIGTLVKDDAVKGYIADVSASLICEKLAETMHQKIGIYAEQELNANISNRYSPGYCGWPVSDQHVLFALLPPDFCGISLNEAALMHPIKSVSGIIGIGKDISEKEYPCDGCTRNDCIVKSGR